MDGETVPPTAANMELNYRHCPNRTRTILDELQSPHTLFGRHITTDTRTPGQDPPEIVTPDTWGWAVRPVVFSTNAMTDPAATPMAEPDTTVSFTNEDTEAVGVGDEQVHLYGVDGASFLLGFHQGQHLWNRTAPVNAGNEQHRD